MDRMTDNQRVRLLKAIRQSGIFVTSGHKEKVNIMSTHWGSLGTFWNKPVFILPVRKSKLTHSLIDETGCFAISVPAKDMRNEIIMCDHLSGYDSNKFESLHLHPKRTKKIPTYTISECGLFLECKVIYKTDMQREQLDDKLREEMYSQKDFHTMYFAEVVAVYENED